MNTQLVFYELKKLQFSFYYCDLIFHEYINQYYIKRQQDFQQVYRMVQKMTLT